MDMAKKFNIAKFCGKDKNRPIFGGIHYENGRACASDGAVLACVLTGYDQADEGKTIHSDGYEIQGTYPDGAALVERTERRNSIHVKLDLALLQVACSWCKKDLFTIVSVPVLRPDGVVVHVGFDFKRLSLVVDACIALGIREARFDPERPERQAVIFSNAYAAFLLMPVIRGGNEISTDGTISMTQLKRADLADLAGAYERTAATSTGRKEKAAAKKAAYVRDLLEKADAGRWMDPATLYGPNDQFEWVRSA